MPTVVSSEQTERYADEYGDEAGEVGDGQRDAATVDQAQELIPAQLIGAQDEAVLSRLLEAIGNAGGVNIEIKDILENHRHQDADQGEDEQHRNSENGEAIAQDELKRVAPERTRMALRFRPFQAGDFRLLRHGAPPTPAGFAGQG